MCYHTTSNICQGLQIDNQCELWEYMTAVLALVHSSLLSEELTSTRETDEKILRKSKWTNMEKVTVLKKGLSGIRTRQQRHCVQVS